MQTRPNLNSPRNLDESTEYSISNVLKNVDDEINRTKIPTPRDLNAERLTPGTGIMTPPMLTKQKSAQQLLIEFVAHEVASQNEKTTALHSCHGELLDLMARYLPQGSRPAPDERSALTKALFHVAQILTMKAYDRQPYAGLIKSTAAAAQMATEGYQAPLGNTIIAARERHEITDETAGG